MLRFGASKISLECHHGCKTTLKKAVLTPPRLPTCHLKRHQTCCDKLTWEASGSCLTARQPCHLILLWHGIQGTRGLNPTLASLAERVLRTALHDETTLRQLVFVYVVVENAISVTLLDQNQHKCNDLYHDISCHTIITFFMVPLTAIQHRGADLTKLLMSPTKGLNWEVYRAQSILVIMKRVISKRPY